MTEEAGVKELDRTYFWWSKYRCLSARPWARTRNLYFTYPKEGHGFKQLEHRLDAWSKQLGLPNKLLAAGIRSEGHLDRRRGPK